MSFKIGMHIFEPAKDIHAVARLVTRTQFIELNRKGGGGLKDESGT